MKRFFHSLILVAALAVGFSACKKEKDDSDNPTPTPAANRLKEFNNNGEFVRFSYNGDGSVSKVIVNSDVNTGGVDMEYTVSYQADKKIKELVTTGGDKIVPVYTNGVLSRADIFEGGTRIGYTNYVYTNNQLTKVTIYFGAGTNFEPFLEFNLTYNAAGNITQSLVMMTNGVPGTLVRAGHTNLQYDQKANPLYDQRELLALFWQGASKNNVTVEDHFDRNQQAEDKYVYNYTYKANGLPQSAVVTQGLPGQTQTTTNVAFTYY